MWKPGDNRSHKCMSSVVIQVSPRSISKRGAEFDKNGPNFTEDVDFAIRTNFGLDQRS